MVRLQILCIKLYLSLRAIRVMVAVFAISILRSKFLIWKIRERRLQKLLASAVKNVPYYRSAVKPATNFSLSDFPIVNKSMLMGNFNQFVSDPRISSTAVSAFLERSNDQQPYFLNRYVVCLTSGTSGMIGRFVIDLKTWASLRVINFSRLVIFNLNFSRRIKLFLGNRLRLAALIAAEGYGISYLSNKLIPPILRSFIKIEHFSILAPTSETAKNLEAFRPEWIHAYPSAVENLATEKLAGRTSINPSVITTASEPFSEEGRSLVARAFPNATIRDHYGCTEFSAMASECFLGRFHLNEEYCILEPLDANNLPVPVGTASTKTLLTNLLNTAQPIIRYELGDSISFTGEKCDCGSPFSVIEIYGRAADKIHLVGEKNEIHTLTPLHFKHLFYRYPGVKQYQVAHLEQNLLELRCTLHAGAQELEARKEVEQIFTHFFSERGLKTHVRFKVVCLDEIPRDPKSQKVRLVYSLVKAPV